MRHIYIRGAIGLIWLIAAVICGASGSVPVMGLYLVLAGVFLYCEIGRASCRERV